MCSQHLFAQSLTSKSKPESQVSLTDATHQPSPTIATHPTLEAGTAKVARANPSQTGRILARVVESEDLAHIRIEWVGDERRQGVEEARKRVHDAVDI